ncbi:MAG: hypothetical protein AAF936_03095 [Pseudomonadota bacterium]
MRNFLLAIAAIVCAAAAPVMAQGPGGFARIYDEPTDVNLGGRPVVADIAFYVDEEAASRGDLQLALVTDVTKFVEETERDLENWIAAHQNRCGERWGAGKPQINFPPDQIRFALYLEYEMWNCGLRGRGEPGRMVREAGEIDVTLDAYVESGRLQARLADLTIDQRSGVSKYLPLEFVTRRVLDSELNKLNQNKKFYQAPKPLIDEGFRYVSIEAEITDDDRVIITARYEASGEREIFDRLMTSIREDGITQEQK